MNCINHSDKFAPYNCYLCKNPICPDCETKLKGKSVCKTCHGRLRQQVANLYETETKQLNSPCGFFCGLVAAVSAAFAWSQIAIMTGSTFDIGAPILGGVVGYGVMKGAGKKRGRLPQEISLTLTILGIFFAHFLVFWRTQPQLYSKLSEGGPAFLGALFAFPAYLGEISPMAWFLFILGSALAYSVPRVRALSSP